MGDPQMLLELGEDADLLLKQDAWLESHRVALQARMSELIEELESVLQAQRLKRELQQKNLVALQYVIHDDGIPDIVIRVLSLPDAIAVLDRQKANPTIPNGYAAKSVDEHVRMWENDGYDVRAARNLRKHCCD